MCRLVTLASVLTVFAAPGPRLAAAPSPATCERLEEWMPEDVIGYLKLHDLGKGLVGFLGSSIRRELERSALGAALRADERFQRLLRELESLRQASGREPLELFQDLLGREVAIGVRLGFRGPEVIALSRARSPEALAQAIEALKKAAAARLGALPETRKRTQLGYAIEEIDKLAFTAIGEVLAVTVNSSALDQVLQLAAGRSRSSVVASAVFTKALSSSGKDKLAALAVRPSYLPNFQIPEKADNPVGSLLLSGWLGALGASDLLTAALEMGDDGLRLELAALLGPGGLEPRYAPLFSGRPIEPLIGRLERIGLLALVELHRDLAGWWEKREELLLPEAAGGLAGFSQIMNLVFARSFQDEVLPELGDTVLLVARNQSYEELGGARPQPAIPAFALLLELKSASAFSRPLATAFQTFIGFANADRAQKKKDNATTMLVQSEKVGKTSIYTASLGSPEKTAAAPGIEFNFSPSMAVAGSWLVLGSSAELTRKLAGELEDLPAGKPAGAGKARDRLVIDARALRAILEENFEALIADNMIKKGHTRAQAKGEIDALLQLTGLLRELRLESRFDGEALRVGIDVRADSGGDEEKPEPKAEPKAGAQRL
jgi:hypothetical protein